MEDQAEVCPLSRGVMLPEGATPIRPITGRRSLAPPSHTRTAIGLPCGRLSLAGTVRAYQVPIVRPDGLGALSPPVALGAHDRGAASPCARHVACLAWSLSACFGSVPITVFNESSRVLAVPSTLAPHRPMLATAPSPHGLGAGLAPVGSIVSGLFTGRCLPASPPRVLVMGHQVPSRRTSRPEQSHYQLHVALQPSGKARSACR
jgi:hypothetical protein